MKSSKAEKSLLQEESLWFDEGLRFRCVPGCGDCCKGIGDVWVDEKEIKKLSEHLSISVEKFMDKYIRKKRYIFSEGSGWTLKDNKNQSCIFYKDGCSVYVARPKQCKTYPFWGAILSSERQWLREAKVCPGINKGKTHSKKGIWKKLIALSKKPYSI